jgi:NADH-quinone oxidoreductase subunit N
LITIAALNMVIALYYYLKVIMAMFMQSNEKPIEKIPVGLQPGIAIALCTGGILVTGIVSGAYHYIYLLVQ